MDARYDEAFHAWWMRTAIPGEYDGWDECDRYRWRSICRSAFEAGAATASPSPTVATQQAEGLQPRSRARSR